MAKKIDTVKAKALKNLGIIANIEEEARDKLVVTLEKEGIEDIENESIDILIDLANCILDYGATDEEG